MAVSHVILNTTPRTLPEAAALAVIAFDRMGILLEFQFCEQHYREVQAKFSAPKPEAAGAPDASNGAVEVDAAQMDDQRLMAAIQAARAAQSGAGVNGSGSAGKRSADSGAAKVDAGDGEDAEADEAQARRKAKGKGRAI